MIDERRSSAWLRTVILCFLGGLCEGFDVQAAGVAAAALGHDFHATSRALGYFFGASGAGLIVGALVGGYLADRVGRKTVLVASIGAFGLFSLLTSIAPGMPSLTVARLLTGLGLGGAMPNLIVLAADSSGPKRRNSSIAAAYFGMPLGGVAASLVAYAAPLESWRIVFQIGGVAPLMIVPLMVLYLPRSMLSGPDAARRAPLRVKMPPALLVPGRILNTLLLWAGFFLIVLTLHLMVNWLPFLLIGRGLLKGQAVMAQLGFNVGGAATALIVGTQLDSARQRMAMIASLVVLPIVLYSIAMAPARAELLFGLAVLLGGAILAQQVIVYGVASVCYPAAARGGGMGAAVAAGRVGSLAGPLFAAWLLAAGRSPSQVLVGVLPIVVVCGTIVGYLGWRELRSRAEATPSVLEHTAAQAATPVRSV